MTANVHNGVNSGRKGQGNEQLVKTQDALPTNYADQQAETTVHLHFRPLRHPETVYTALSGYNKKICT